MKKMKSATTSKRIKYGLWGGIRTTSTATDTTPSATSLSHIICSRLQFFPSMIFCGEAAKKTSIDGLKWSDLVVVGW